MGKFTGSGKFYRVPGRRLRAGVGGYHKSVKH
jgi:hypothetical protein